MNTHYLEFEVTLLEVRQRLWRRFLLRHTFSFEELHGAIQLACGWQFCHLYEFRDENDQCIATGDQVEMLEDEDHVPLAEDVPLKSFFKQPGQQCRYVYDFGDNWQHRVTLRQKVTLQERFVQRLTGGDGMFPPEDCGGTWGYEDCIRAWQLTPAEIRELDPGEREELTSLKEWLGDWGPDGFDLEAAKRDFER